MAHGPKHPVPTISTHVLDTERGLPAVGVHVTLYRIAGDGRPFRLTQALDRRRRPGARPARSAPDGRRLPPGVRPRLELDDAVPGGPAATNPFFRRLSVDLRVTDTERSYHVPLLLSPFGMTTYRGS